MYIFLFGAFLFSSNAYAQDTDTSETITLTGKAAQDLLKQLGLDKSISNMKHGASKDACKCIEEISGRDKTDKEISKEIGACIEAKIDDFLMTEATSSSLLDTGNVTLVGLENKRERKRAYFEMERFLRDSCQSLDDLMTSDDKQGLNSMSDNQEALRYYYDGLDAFKAKDLTKSVKLYKKAVAIDDNFAFAWDNLGLAYRYLKKYDKALASYKKSLQVSPGGSLPLQNIPIVYQYMNKPEMALDAYNNLTRLQPDNAEGYFGKGRMLSMMKKDVPALHSMCQAYNIYKKTNNPYRADAEKVMAYLYSKIANSKNGKKKFYNILNSYDIELKFAD